MQLMIMITTTAEHLETEFITVNETAKRVYSSTEAHSHTRFIYLFIFFDSALRLSSQPLSLPADDHVITTESFKEKSFLKIERLISYIFGM